MNMFQFAVASIVDANTGNGLVHGSGKRDYIAAERYGRKIRARSIADVIAAIKSRLVEAVGSYRDAARGRRELRRLINLNDHLLEDIGLHRGDLYAVQLGVSTLDELNKTRRSSRQGGLKERGEVSSSETVNLDRDAINEQFYDQMKCA